MALQQALSNFDQQKMSEVGFKYPYVKLHQRTSSSLFDAAQRPSIAEFQKFERQIDKEIDYISEHTENTDQLQSRGQVLQPKFNQKFDMGAKADHSFWDKTITAFPQITQIRELSGTQTTFGTMPANQNDKMTGKNEESARKREQKLERDYQKVMGQTDREFTTYTWKQFQEDSRGSPKTQALMTMQMVKR